MQLGFLFVSVSMISLSLVQNLSDPSFLHVEIANLIREHVVHCICIMLPMLNEDLLSVQ